MVYQYANHLAASGFRVSVLHMRPPGTEGRIRRVFLGFAFLLGRAWRPRWFALDRRVFVRNYLRQAQHRIPIDTELIVATSVRTADFVNCVAAARGIRTMYLIQHVETWDASESAVEATWRLPFRRVVVSGWLKDQLARRGIASTLVRNGIDLAAYPAGLPVADRRPSIVSLVSELHWKRTDIVAAVMQEIADARPDVAFRAFGVCERPECLPSFVEFTRNPPASRLAKLYAESSIYLCASDFEGFGLPVAEALAAGCAVVSTDNGGVPDYLGDLTSFAAPGDVRGLSHLALALLADSAEMERIAREGRHIVETMTVAQAVRGFEAICAELLE
jgi:glycosyltransferase involved in cell wall biosynthesis